MASVPIIPFLVEGRAGQRSGLEFACTHLRQALLWPVRVARGRRELARIAALSDRELGDIGLTRHDVRNASALSLDEDPTRYFASVVGERRRAERARASMRPFTRTGRP